MVKKGDTLIEVTLAIGIFSMVAIAIVAVMLSGTSNAQTALETTLAREEIDTQAEALRFIHEAYLADEENEDEDDPYTLLWNEITSNAYTGGEASYLQYAPTTCQDVFPNSVSNLPGQEGAFFINPRALNNLTAETISDAYKTDRFLITQTYPRIFYENDSDPIAEGIYVLAVKDPDSTNVVGSSKKVSAYYDFYIRTCWYGAGSESPSTISTVIRLYDPTNLKSN